MSQSNCACTCGNFTMVPVGGFGLALDTSTIKGTSLPDYSLEEHWTGVHWIDGKKIYRQVLPLDSLPDSAIKYFPCPINGLDQMVNVRGIITYQDLTNKDYFSVPYGLPSVQGCVGIFYRIIDGEGMITVVTGRDRSADKGYAIMEYTCTDR